MAMPKLDSPASQGLAQNDSTLQQSSETP
jgi:hypothetical protein